MCRNEPATVNLREYRLRICESCFIKFYERKLERTIKRFNLADKEKDKILIAFSGQKDSVALATALSRMEWNVELLHINLGIEGYSDRMESFIKKQAREIGLKLNLVNLKKEYGFTLEELRGSRPTCSVCGMVKRYIMNKYAREHNFSRVTTGHHATDAFLILLKNWIGGQMEFMIKNEPFLPSNHEKLVTKIKPLWNTTEEENRLYVKILQLPIFEARCPYSHEISTKPLLEAWKKLYPRLPIEQTLLNNFLKLKGLMTVKTTSEIPYNECAKCGEVTTGSICTFCKLIENAKNKKL